MSTHKSIADTIKEIQHWLRLATFQHDPIKEALLGVLHNTPADPNYIGLPKNPQMLYQELKTNHLKIIQKLTKKKILKQDQLDLIFPPNSNQTDSNKFDVTLICILIRNCTTLPAPLNGWDDKHPPANDLSIAAFVIRGREWRNFVHHTEPKDIDAAIFNQKWAEGCQIIQGLGLTYNTNRLKNISLDPKHEIVLNSLFNYIAQKERKHEQKEMKQETTNKVVSGELSNLYIQLTNIAKEVQFLKENAIKPTTGYCLQNVVDHINKELTEEESKKIIQRIDNNKTLDDILQNTPWDKLKIQLDTLGRTDITEYVESETLITSGLDAASKKLRHYYIGELVDWLVAQPLSSTDEDNEYISREEIFIDLVVLPSSDIEEELTNSDRDAILKQKHLEKCSKLKAVDKILQHKDEMVFVRGVAGIGKSTLAEMFLFKWAKNELKTIEKIDFIFQFTCREINNVLNDFSTIEELFHLKYPKIMSCVTCADLQMISERILIMIDGLDELQYIYNMDGRETRDTMASQNHLKVVFDMVNTKGAFLKNHKTIVCGRPKACEFVKAQFHQTCKIKTIEVCGFSPRNVQRYIDNFFARSDKDKARIVKKLISKSKNLKVMSSVPVFLWVICNVCSEELLTKSINTNTELYLYSCLILLRNHFRGSTKRYENLDDVIKDESVIQMLYALMELSVKTYMKNQVLFTDEDIRSLRCPFHLEQTGFIVKYNRGNFRQPTYQFKHLVLQEFLTGMYLCVTKWISPYVTNREINSCLPTILGINRLIHENDNRLFIDFYAQLTNVHRKMASFWSKIVRPYRNYYFKNFMEQHETSDIKRLKLPSCMVSEEKTLTIDTIKPECLEYLDKVKESNLKFVGGKLSFEKVHISIHSNYNDTPNILKLLENFHIDRVDAFRKFIQHDVMVELDEDTLALIMKTVGKEIETIIVDHDVDWTPQLLFCDYNNFHIYFSYHTISRGLDQEELKLPEALLEASTSFNYHVPQYYDRSPFLGTQLISHAIENKKKITLSSSITGADRIDGFRNFDRTYYRDWFENEFNMNSENIIILDKDTAFKEHRFKYKKLLKKLEIVFNN